MDRFASVNLAALAPPVAVEAIGFETLRAARMGDFVARAAAVNIPYDVQGLETDPIVINQEAGAYRETLLRERIDEAVLAVLLPTAEDTDLDQIGAQYGCQRLVLVPATGNTAAIMEQDDPFRSRIQMAWEALSVAGPPGAYEYLAASASGLVIDARCYGAEYTSFVNPGQVVITILSSEAGGIASQATLQAVSDAFGGYALRLANPQPGSADIVVFDRAKTRSQACRPLNDQVFVEVAQIVPYQLQATLILPPGPDSSIVLSQAIGRAQAFAADRYRIEGAATIAGFEAALGVPNSAGVSPLTNIVLASPPSDVGPTPRAAPFCTGIAVTAQVMG
ncbi:MAG: baseplate assembly protein [Janthinobacterium lividum]